MRTADHEELGHTRRIARRLVAQAGGRDRVARELAGALVAEAEAQQQLGGGAPRGHERGGRR